MMVMTQVRSLKTEAGNDLFGRGSIWPWIYLAVGLDLAVDPESSAK